MHVEIRPCIDLNIHHHLRCYCHHIILNLLIFHLHMFIVNKFDSSRYNLIRMYNFRWLGCSELLYCSLNMFRHYLSTCMLDNLDCSFGKDYLLCFSKRLSNICIILVHQSLDHPVPCGEWSCMTCKWTVKMMNTRYMKHDMKGMIG